MARKPDPTRKPALIKQALEFLVDRPLSSLTFRSLAKALDVSTFTLVYHFGTRAELVREIVRANVRGMTAQDAADLPAATVDEYIASLYSAWQWTQLPENLHRQRLELEAGLLEAVERDQFAVTRHSFHQWVDLGARALVALGVDREQAVIESRLLVNTLQGMQFDLMVNENLVASNAVFNAAVQHHRDRIESHIGEVTR
ncbi:TetR/AcrR family transcriptional regulator [Salinibacterium sp. TMP30]|uniref:TetR/AcrR family transcriptional regulator n=1 Tax=Salinibacterium sp. TMP30 TaxID=3138237 RepID=UPI0031399949